LVQIKKTEKGTVVFQRKKSQAFGGGGGKDVGHLDSGKGKRKERPKTGRDKEEVGAKQVSQKGGKKENALYHERKEIGKS